MINQARIVFGASANGRETGPGLAGVLTIGTGQQTVNFPDADICYCVGAQLSSTSDYFNITLTSGVVTGATGGATIQDGDGKDFQGATLPTMTKLYAILVEETYGKVVVISNTYTKITGSGMLWDANGMLSSILSSGLLINCDEASEVFITIIGKS